MASGLLLSEMGDVEKGTSEASLLLDGVALRCGPDEGGLFPDKPAGPSGSGLWLGLWRPKPFSTDIPALRLMSSLIQMGVERFKCFFFFFMRPNVAKIHQDSGLSHSQLSSCAVLQLSAHRLASANRPRLGSTLLGQ